MQSKKQSFLESLTNTIISTLIAVIVGPFVYKAWGIPITVFQFSGVTLTFIIISIIRNYFIRRYFPLLSNRIVNLFKKRL